MGTGTLRLSRNFNFACFCWREGAGDVLERLAFRLRHKEYDKQQKQDEQDDEDDERVLQQRRLYTT